MENKNRYSKKENIDPVSRKSNEEIDEDEVGNLIIGGKYIEENKSIPSDGPFSEDVPKGKNSLTNTAEED